MIPYNTDAPLYHMPIATVGLIIVNTLLFFAVPSSMLEPEIEIGVVQSDEGLEAFDPFGANVKINYPSNTLVLQHGSGIKPWQWLTSIFMHAGFFHLLFNMIALWAFGLVVEGKVGSLVFLGLYLGIGVGQSGLEQLLLSFASPGASLGASAAIFGILGIAIVWAPSNEFDVFWAFGFRGGSIEIPVMVYGFISFALEIASVVFGHFGISSSVLHLMGLGMGIAAGFVWLRRGWVDCEGWDLISVWHGKEGKHEENADLDKEASDLIRSSLGSGSQRGHKAKASSARSSKASSARASAAAAKRPAAKRPAPEQSSEPWHESPESGVPATAVGPLADLEQLIEAGNSATAAKLLSKLRLSGRAPELPQAMLGRLIRDLLSAQAYDAVVPLLVEHIDRFSQSRVSLQLNLAKVLLHLERPKKAVAVLREMEPSKLDESAKATWGRLATHAKKLIADGSIELSD